MSFSRWLNALLGRATEPEPAAAPPPAPEAPPFTPAVNPELEAAIEADPDATDAWLVWADWLQQHGDPRGEIVALAASEDPAARREAEARVTAHRRSLLGARVASLEADLLEIDWHFGHARRVKVGAAYEDTPLHELLDAFLAAPAARFVREIGLGVAYSDDGMCNYDACTRVLAARRPATLRGLRIGDFLAPDEMEVSWSDAGDLSPLWAAFPKLGSLEIQAGQLVLGDIEAPWLTRFVVRTGGLTKAAMRSIAHAKWPWLTHLEIWFGDRNYGAECDVDDLAPILAGEGLPQLRHLGLCNAEFTDELCGRLADAPLVARLQSLDLTKGTMGAAGAEALIAGADRLRHLRSIDVSDNWVGAMARVPLLRALPNVVSIAQQDEEPGGARYVQVGE